MLPDRKLPRFHTGHDTARFFYSAVRQLPEKVLEIAFNNGYDYWSIAHILVTQRQREQNQRQTRQIVEQHPQLIDATAAVVVHSMEADHRALPAESLRHDTRGVAIGHQVDFVKDPRPEVFECHSLAVVRLPRISRCYCRCAEYSLMSSASMDGMATVCSVFTGSRASNHWLWMIG